MKYNIRGIIKDIIISSALVFVGYLALKDVGDDPSHFTERIILLVLGIVTLFEVCEKFNLSIIVPNYFLHAREKKQQKAIDYYMDSYFENDTEFIKTYDNERMNYFLSQLGITRTDLEKIRLDIIKLRCMPIKTIKDAREKLKFLIGGKHVTIRQKDILPAKLTYKKVGYFINFIDLMFLPECSSLITSIFEMLITETIDIRQVDKIVVPYDSNFLLGFDLSKRLSIPVVNIRKEEGRILSDQKWDGVLNPSDRVIFIHDVLVTGEQVVESMNNIPRTCEILAFFCLVVRTDFTGLNHIKDYKDIEAHYLLELNDNDIESLLAQRRK